MVHKYAHLHYSDILSNYNDTVHKFNEVSEATLRFGKVSENSENLYFMTENLMKFQVTGAFSYSAVDALRNASSSLHRALHINPNSYRSW